LLLLAAVALANPLFAAQPLSEDKFTTLRAARLGPEGATLYLDEQSPCTQNDRCTPSENTPLKPGSIVFVYPSRNGLGPLGVHLYKRYVHAQDLIMLPFDPHPLLKDWRGKWKTSNGSIQIAPSSDGGIRVDGVSIFEGRGSLRLGQLHATAPAPRTNVVVLHHANLPNCEVHLALLSPVLVANDNGGCGSVNARFWSDSREAPRRSVQQGHSAPATKHGKLR
jgi:hypothetical protein